MRLGCLSCCGNSLDFPVFLAYSIAFLSYFSLKFNASISFPLKLQIFFFSQLRTTKYCIFSLHGPQSSEHLFLTYSLNRRFPCFGLPFRPMLISTILYPANHQLSILWQPPQSHFPSFWVVFLSFYFLGGHLPWGHPPKVSVPS